MLVEKLMCLCNMWRKFIEVLVLKYEIFKKFYRGYLFFLGSKKDKKFLWIFRFLVICNINGDIYLYKINYICLCVIDFCECLLIGR